MCRRFVAGPIALQGKLAAGCLCASQPTVSAIVGNLPTFCPTCYPCHLIFLDRLLACSSISAEVGPSLGPVRHPISLLRLSWPLQLGKGRGAAPRKEAQPHQPDQPDQLDQPGRSDQIDRPDQPDQPDRPDQTR